MSRFLFCRYTGHSVADPDSLYRSREEIKRIRHKYDPIEMLRKKILSEELVKQDELEAIEKKNSVMVKNAVQAALQDTEPPLSDLVNDVYVKYDDKIRTTGISEHLQRLLTNHRTRVS